MVRLSPSPRTSRVLRLLAVSAAALTSVATFGGDDGWELNTQKKDAAAVVLSASSTSFTDDFEVNGNGTGKTSIRFDGAVELTPSNPLAQAVQVRVRYVPMGSTEVEESTVFVRTSTVFTAVTFAKSCDADVPCVQRGTFEVEVLDPTALSGESLSLHWVATAKLLGRGPAAPADATLRLTQP